MKPMWRVVSVVLLLTIATCGSLFWFEKVRAGTPVVGNITVDTIWSPSGSPYWVETGFTVVAGVDLTILAGTEVRFNGFHHMFVDGRLLVLGNATDPVIFTYNGSTPSPEDWHGIYVFGETHINYANISYAHLGLYVESSFNTVNDSSFYRNWNALGLEIGSDNVIQRNMFYNSTYCGVIVGQSSNNSIIQNNVTNNGDTGIWLSGGTHNNVSANKLHGNGWNGIRIWGQSSLNIISNNVIEDSKLYQGIGVWDSFGNRIANNTIRRSHNNGIYLEGSSGNNVSGNEITDSLSFHGISLFVADSNEIVGNGIARVGMSGIYLERAWDNKVLENTMSNGTYGVYALETGENHIARNNMTSFGEGIHSEYSQNMTILGNTMRGGWPGIELYYAMNASITGNRISSYRGAGIYLHSASHSFVKYNNISSNNIGVQSHFSDNTTISDNEILNNLIGIYLLVCDNVSIMRNNIRLSQDTGIYYFFSSSTSVFHNNLVGNSNQASDPLGYENSWDDGYPSGGNYWSDYAGVDVKSGVNQDLPGSDGIGDTPYVIDADSLDRYPLMSPFEPFPGPPIITGITLTGQTLENVTLTWSLSEDDGAGLGTVVRYEVYRNMAYDRQGSGYQLVASLPNRTSTFTDSSAGEGNPNNLFYIVCAVDGNNRSTCAVDQAAKVTRLLSQGPNLVSVPLIQSDESIELVLQTVKFGKAWYYDSVSRQWTSFMKAKTYGGNLRSVDHTMGIWIDVTEDSNLTVTGVVPTQTTIRLYEGWNLVSFPSFKSSYRVWDLKAATGAVRVEGYDSAPPYFLRVLLVDADVLLAGEGYWVKAEADTDWIVEVS